VSAPLYVVVVEDDESSRKAMGRLLRAGGFDPLMFESAEAYLASAPLPFSAVAMVLDLQLPGLSGFGLQRQLRAEGRTLPVVVITAQDEAGSRAEAERLGCLAYLSKPCNGRIVLDLLAALVGQGPSSGTHGVTKA
jgi:FixJ family two-component response regulator